MSRIIQTITNWLFQMKKTEYFLVWNDDKSVGFLTLDASDAFTAAYGSDCDMANMPAQEFFESYGRSEHPIESVKI